MNPFIFQQLRAAESSISSHQARVLRARTIRELVLAKDVHLPSIVKSLAHTLPGWARLRSSAEDMARTIVEAQVKGLNALPPEEYKAAFQKLYAQDWQLLRGNFPRQFVEVDALRMKLSHVEAASPPKTE